MKKKKKRKNSIQYSRVFIFVALLLFCVMIWRVIQLGTSSEIDGVNLKDLASKRTTRTDTISAQRGTIYSADGDALAQNVASYKLIAYLDPKRTTNPKRPQHVIDKEATADALAPILGMERDEILKFLNKENVYQTEFGTKGKGLNEITKNQIEDLELPGIDFIESFKRYYPKGKFASYVIGYAKESEDTGTIKGEMGIEKQYDKVLKGQDGSRTYQKDLKGYRIPDTPVYTEDAVQGKDIYLTINSSIQFFVEQAISNSDKTYDWEWYTVTILDAKTGAVLATASDPGFNPNYRDITNYMDIFCQTPYEPGSTMKTFTYMAAMENGVYNGSETYRSGTYETSDGTVIGDWNRNGWGTITFDKGYAYSSNVGVINIINRHMNSTMLRQYFRRLGFGKKTGIELPNENKGKLDFKYETEIYNAGFGQGILTTPIQNAKAMTVLTNDGILLEPYLVEKIVDSDTGEVTLENKRTEIERVASTGTVQKMISLMDDTVNGYGNTGSGFRIDGGELIGKTGTAQIASENGRGYLQGQEDIISSFSGIYPKSNPQIIIYASVKRPSGGSQKALSNAIKEIVKNVSKYYGNSDTQTASIAIADYKVPSLVNKKLDTAKTMLDANGIKYVVLGNGVKVMKQTPSKDDVITTNDTIFLITNDSNIKVPNVVGYSSKVAKDLLTKLGISVTLDGVGYVTSQSVAPDTDITDGLAITLTLSPKYVVE
ncbi:MAG: penicillin-binding protein [Bacilli bacterium]|nr:penicillin-binding protein [Bacilli bacterium]MBR6137201.1 penicillin-binding protein [Bacilli bacterium]